MKNMIRGMPTRAVHLPAESEDHYQPSALRGAIEIIIVMIVIGAALALVAWFLFDAGPPLLHP
jgi:hypothetical protein